MNLIRYTCRNAIAMAALILLSFPAFAQTDCGPTAEKNGAFCYPLCKAGYHGVGPVCWASCPSGYTDDGATCRQDVQIFSADNSKCPWYDKCGLTFAKSCSTCPAGYANDGCTCRRDVHILAKDSYGRGAGFLVRSEYRRIFTNYINDHRNIWQRLGTPLTAQEKTYLLQWFPVRLVEGMRAYEMVAMTGAFIHNASATTYGSNFIIFKIGERSLKTLKHEMVHACQYDKLGVEGFSRAYADQFVDGGYAYERIGFELEAMRFAAINDTVKTPIRQFLGYCQDPVDPRTVVPG